MSQFMLTLNNELYKLRHKKKYYVMLVIGAAVCALRWGGTALISKLTGGQVVIKSNIVIEMLPLFAELIIPIMMIMAAADLISGEYAADTIKADLLRPVTRFKLLLAKSAAVTILGAAALTAFYVICAVIQLLCVGSADNLGITLAAYIIDIVPLAGVALLAVLVNVCVNNPSGAVLLSLAVYAVMKYMGYYIAGSESFLFTSYAKWHTLFLGTALPLNVILYKIGIVFGSILILFSVSYIIFDNKDI